jgi:hypothetical protein
MIRKFGNVTGLTNQPQGLDVGLGGISAPWMNDWSAYSTVYDWSQTTASVPTVSWYTFVNISGAGFLKFVRAYCWDLAAAEYPDVRITIDGIAYVFTGVSGSAGVEIGNLLSQPISFSTSLKIEVFNRHTATASMACDYTYLLKTGTPNPTKQTILMASNRRIGFNQTSSTLATDIVNITGSGYLLDVEFGGYNTAINSNSVHGTLIVDGVTKMNDVYLIRAAGGDQKLTYYKGPIRFTSSLQVRHRVDGASVVGLSRAFYTLD